MTGGDIIALGKNPKTSPSPMASSQELGVRENSLPGGAKAEFLVPEGCTNLHTAIMQIHGGGYTLGYLPVFQRRVDKLSRLGGMVPVFSLDYRTAPEHPYPAALDDTLQAVEWLSRVKRIPPESVITIGDRPAPDSLLRLRL
jgi:acetyl esterase/lipase